MKFRWMWMACLAFMTSCGKEIPSDIIQPLKMEKVLYDYHLSMGVSSNMDNAEKEACKKFVFQKHGISEAEFDSSMVWYTRETKELTAIYNNLDRKFNQEHKQIERLLETIDKTIDSYNNITNKYVTYKDYKYEEELEINIAFLYGESETNALVVHSISTPEEFMKTWEVEKVEGVSEWAKEAWQWAKEKGYLDGTNPKGTVTREMLAQVLFNLFGKEK